MTPNPFIERTPSGLLRTPAFAAHVKRSAAPPPDLGNLARLQDAEQKAFDAMQGFWEQAQVGEHP
jgi:hypothetical protein